MFSSGFSRVGFAVKYERNVPVNVTSPDGEKGIDNQLFRALGCLLAVTAIAVVLFAIAAFVRDKLPARRDIITLALLGLIGNGLYQLFFIFGMSRTRAGVAALVVAAGPAWIAIISRMLGREHLPMRGWSGIGLQLLGVACVVGSARGFEGGRDVMLGAGLIAMGSIAWATFSVLLQPYTKTAHPLHLSAITMSSALMM